MVTEARAAPNRGAEALGSRAEPRSEAVPVLLVRVDSRAARVLLWVLVVVGAGWMAKTIAGPVIASAVADVRANAARLEQALAWDPGDAHLHQRLAAEYLALGDAAGLDRARRHLETALRRRPAHAFTWLGLARLDSLAGDRARARRALDLAVLLSPHDVNLRWEAALLALEWGERDLALGHLAYVLIADPNRRSTAFDLARRLLRPEESLTALVPAKAQPLTDLLEVALGHQDARLAQLTWERRVGLAPPIPEHLRRQYVELLLRTGRGAAARAIWRDVVSDGYAAPAGDAMWNGGFEARALLGWGFDWQVLEVPGVRVGLDGGQAAEGRQSLRLMFTRVRGSDFAGVWQTVAVEPGRIYRLRALAKASGLVTRSGLKLQVLTTDGGRVLAETEGVSGTTSDWVRLESRVQIPAGVSLVQVRVRCDPPRDSEDSLAGKVWLDDVRLVPAEGAGA